MPTVTKTIGTSSRDFSTIAAWAAALPANLVTDGNSYVGQCFNDAEFAVTSTITINGNTTDATHTIQLTTGAGQSFRDNAGAQTNALRYNQANGVGIRKTNNYNQTLTTDADFITFTGLQIATTGGNSPNGLTTTNATGHQIVDFCIVENVSGSNTASCVVKGSSAKIRNSLVVVRGNSTGAGLALLSGAGAYNCTVVRTGTAGDTGVSSAYASSVVENCALFGFTTASSGTITGSGNITDQASGPGTSPLVSKTYANQFQNTSDATRDFRLKAGADCLDAGTTDSTNAANDIVGTTRPQGGAYDIGCWELVVAAVAAFLPSPRRRLRRYIAPVRPRQPILRRGAVPNLFRQSLQASDAAVASMVRQAGIPLQASDGALATMVRQTGKPLSASDAAVAAMVEHKTTAVALSASDAAVASMVKQTGKPLSASNSAVATMVRAVGKALQATDSAVASMVRSCGKALGASDAAAATMVRQVGKPLAALDAAVASMTRQTSKSLAASDAAVATLTTIKVKLQSLAASNAAVASMVRQTGKVLQASDSAVASMSRAIAKSLSAVNSAIASMVRSTGKPLAATNAAVATLSHAFSKTLSASNSAIATMARQTGKGLAAGNSALATMVRGTGKALQAVTSPLATMVRAIAKPLQASNAALATIIKVVPKKLAAATTPVATLFRGFARTLSASTTPVATIALLKHIGHIILQRAKLAGARVIAILKGSRITPTLKGSSTTDDLEGEVDQ